MGGNSFLMSNDECRGDYKMSTELQLWSNWITGAGVVVSAALTGAIIYLTNKTASENKRSADAAEKSAKSANETFKLTKEMMASQKSKEQRMWENYRRFYGKKIVEYSIGCANALIHAFNVHENVRDYSLLKKPDADPDFLQEQLFLYFEMDEIDKLFNCIRDFLNLKKEFTDKVGGPDYDWNKASPIASYLIGEFQSFTRIFDIR
jgi:hypothetical protein